MLQYTGQILEGKMHGKGTAIYSVGNEGVTETYEGDWIQSKRQGEGTYKFKDGVSYHGQWDNDQINGKGTAHYPNGNVYEGDWVQGKIEGNGFCDFMMETHMKESGKMGRCMGRESIIMLTVTPTMANGSMTEGTALA